MSELLLEIERMSLIDSFKKNGYVGPFKLYEPEEAKELLKIIRIKSLDKSRALFDNDVNYDRHFDIPELSQHIGHPGIISRLQPILGRNILCWRTEFFPKFPGSKATEWHQVENYQYATGTPQLEATIIGDATTYDLTVWTTFTPATKENGCMKFLPGSHKKKYYDESITPQSGRKEKYQSVLADTGFYGYRFEEFKVDPNWDPDREEIYTAEMQAGECIIFTARCVHGSYPNTTQRSTRFAISSRYVPTHVKIYPNQPSMEAHGGFFDLTRHGAVLVSGQDTFGHNRIKRKNNLEMNFPYFP